jgi:Fe-S-cluster containining protein
MRELFRLHAEIDARVDAIRRDQPEWLCRMGCANCCRRLAAIPTLTAGEWEVLRQGLAALPAERLAEVRRRMEQMEQQAARPYTCPMLDATTEACMVYAYRPVACRTYGYYQQRGFGLYCADIEKLAAEGALDGVVWGNHDAIDRRLGDFGETRRLTDWFAAWQPAAPASGG